MPYYTQKCSQSSQNYRLFSKINDCTVFERLIQTLISNNSFRISCSISTTRKPCASCDHIGDGISLGAQHAFIHMVCATVHAGVASPPDDTIHAAYAVQHAATQAPPSTGPLLTVGKNIEIKNTTSIFTFEVTLKIQNLNCLYKQVNHQVFMRVMVKNCLVSQSYHPLPPHWVKLDP